MKLQFLTMVLVPLSHVEYNYMKLSGYSFQVTGTLLEGAHPVCQLKADSC